MTIKFELTVDEVNLVFAGLGELPAKVSMNLIAKLQQQAQTQVQQPPVNSGEGQ